jgi:hypothetical protein
VGGVPRDQRLARCEHAGLRELFHSESLVFCVLGQALSSGVSRGILEVNKILRWASS